MKKGQIFLYRVLGLVMVNLWQSLRLFCNLSGWRDRESILPVKLRHEIRWNCRESWVRWFGSKTTDGRQLTPALGKWGMLTSDKRRTITKVIQMGSGEIFYYLRMTIFAKMLKDKNYGSGLITLITVARKSTNTTFNCSLVAYGSLVLWP